jgi:hypothetical protein
MNIAAEPYMKTISERSLAKIASSSVVMDALRSGLADHMRVGAR